MLTRFTTRLQHHLFPRMSSAWYPYIQPAVREVCQKHSVRYAYYPTFFGNWRSTIKYIQVSMQ
jgi:fatty acid desaturase (delta-4 desaturase)